MYRTNCYGRFHILIIYIAMSGVKDYSGSWLENVPFSHIAFSLSKPDTSSHGYA